MSALCDCRPPVDIAFGGGGRAIGEVGIGGRLFEANRRVFGSAAARTVATGTTGVENGLAGCKTARGRFRLLTANRICACTQEGEDDEKPGVRNGYSMSKDSELAKFVYFTRNNRSCRWSAQRILPSAPTIASSSCAMRTGCPPHSATGVVACNSIENHILGMTFASPLPATPS